MTVSRTSRRPARIGFNLTAMIDVVFLLLVYFMCTTQFKRSEELYRLDLPQRGRQANPFQLPQEPLRISVASAGRGYTLRLSGANARPATFEDLYVFLDENRITESAPGGLYEADYPIIIEPGATTRWEHTMDAFNAAARARYTNINFAQPRVD